MKILLILFCLVTSIFTMEENDFLVGSILPSDTQELALFQRQHKIPETRRFEDEMLLSAQETTTPYKVKYYDNYAEYPPLALYCKGTDVNSPQMKCFLSVGRFTFLDSMEKVRQHAKRENNLTFADSVVARSEEQLTKIKGLVGAAEWLEFDQLTPLMSDSSSSIEPIMIFGAIGFVKANLSDEKLIIRTYQKPEESEQTNAYIACGFKKSEYQYMTQSGLIVYEKQLD